MAFKEKNKIIKKSNNRITLDATHNDKLNDLSTQKNKIIKKEETLQEYKQIYNKLIKDNYKKNINKILELKDYIIELESDLLQLNKHNEIDYLLDAGHLLFDYYDKIEYKSSNYKKISIKNKSVSEYFNVNILQNSRSKAEIYNCYLNKINNKQSKNLINNINLCLICNNEKKLFLSEGKMICEKCGDETKILIDSDKPSYKDPPREISYFAYKRINHFNEWLAQFQAKESTDIPKEIYEEILLELKKERILNVNNLKQSKLREILKKLKKNKYYEHIPHIINKLNGIPPPIMSRKTEEELRRMFKEIQIPFQNNCPPDRKNFLSYSYILHKFVQLLELDEFIPCFILLKSREKLHQQDMIWKKICGELKWEFIPSI